LFNSAASNLGYGTLPAYELFVRDRVARTTRCVSIGPNGELGNGNTFKNRITPDGRYIVFESAASNLVPDDTNNAFDVFVFDQLTQTNTRVSVTSTGAQADNASAEAGISADGRFISLESAATNLVPGAYNGHSQVYVIDRQTLAIEHVSKSALGESANTYGLNTDISSDGRFVVWFSTATNLVPDATSGQVFVFDRKYQRIAVASSDVQGIPGNQVSQRPALSTDGRFVTFVSAATNLLPGGSPSLWSMYRKDLWTNEIILVSVNDAGQSGNGSCVGGAISSDGRYILFQSKSSNLSPEDLSGDEDVFLRDTGWPINPQTYCLATPHSLGCLPAMSFSGAPSVSSGGGFVLSAANLKNQHLGFLFYGTSASTFSSFPAGWLCVAPPLVRTPIQSSGGSALPLLDCSGELQFDFNAYVASGADPTLVAGQAVWCQTWHRDPDLPSASYSSDAVQFTLLP
jgi:Tol biopolymer transport system component